MPLHPSADPGGFVPRLIAAGAVITVDADGQIVLRGGGSARPALEGEMLSFADDLRAMLEDSASLF